MKSEKHSKIDDVHVYGKKETRCVYAQYHSISLSGINEAHGRLSNLSTFNHVESAVCQKLLSIKI